MKRIAINIISASLGLWIVEIFVPGVQINLLANSSFFGLGLNQLWQVILLLGASLGLLNYFVKPTLDLLTLPLRIITLGVFGFFVNMAIIWVLDYIFREFSAPWFWPLFWTTIVVYVINQLTSGFILKNDN